MIVCTLASVLNGIFSALSPVQRWQSAGRFEGNWMTQRWFIVTALVVLIILTLLLLVISLYRTAQEKKTANLLFVKNAEKRGLSEGELKMLIDIARSAGARHKMAVFTMEDAFDRGANRILKKSLTKDANLAEIEGLKRDFYLLREKLGLQNPGSGPSEIFARPNKPNTKQIPIGKKVLITHRTGRQDGEIESTVISNTDTGLKVKLAKHVKINFGDLWSARYYLGPSVWEFDTSVISCDGKVLLLSHSDNARYVNRRRFLRVPVRKEALIASFPFAEAGRQRVDGINADSNNRETIGKAVGSALAAPEFFPAALTELAGPGLRIEVPVEMKKGDRVLVLFALHKENGQQPAETNPDDEKLTFEIVGDIGEVRHTEAVKEGYSVAVELTGLSDADIDYLVRATNAASISTARQNQDTVAEAQAGQDTSKSKIAQGV